MWSEVYLQERCMLPAEAWGRVLCVLGKLSVSLGVQGPLIVTEELHSLSFESELQLNQSGLDIKLEVRPALCSCSELNWS